MTFLYEGIEIEGLVSAENLLSDVSLLFSLFTEAASGYQAAIVVIK